MASRKKLAALLGFDLSVLEGLAAATNNFRTFEIKQGIKLRKVEVPKRRLERVHRKVFSLLERIEKPEYLHSGIKGRSYITNAKVHTGSVPLVKLDLKKFYPSIGGARVYRFFQQALQCSPDVAGLMTKLCIVDGHVPTGSCVSQLLAYFSAKPMFDELHMLSVQWGLRDTCYVDDLTWSGERATPSFLWDAKKVVHRHGFKYHKDRIYTANDQKVVTGVMIEGDRIAVLPSRELKLWKNINALGMSEPLERLAAVNSLIGSVVANGQIEQRFLHKLRRLRDTKVSLVRQLEVDFS
jgi:hypothetical protein